MSGYCVGARRNEDKKMMIRLVGLTRLNVGHGERIRGENGSEDRIRLFDEKGQFLTSIFTHECYIQETSDGTLRIEDTEE